MLDGLLTVFFLGRIYCKIDHLLFRCFVRDSDTFKTIENKVSSATSSIKVRTLDKEFFRRVGHAFILIF